MKEPITQCVFTNTANTNAGTTPAAFARTGIATAGITGKCGLHAIRWTGSITTAGIATAAAGACSTTATCDSSCYA